MFGNIFYSHENLKSYRNQKVQVKYDPDDVSTINVYNQTGEKICVAASYELLKISPKSNEKTLINHLKGQHNEYKSTKKELEYLQMPYEERIDLSEGRFVDAPEIKNKSPKVVALPNDKQFRDEVKNKKNKEDLGHSDFYTRQAEKFLKRIQNL
jgi:hypothetical protein